MTDYVDNPAWSPKQLAMVKQARRLREATHRWLFWERLLIAHKSMFPWLWIWVR